MMNFNLNKQKTGIIFHNYKLQYFTEWMYFTHRSHVYFYLPMIHHCHYFDCRTAPQTKVNCGSDHLPSWWRTAHALSMAENWCIEGIFTFSWVCRYLIYMMTKKWRFCLDDTETLKTNMSEVVQSTSFREFYGHPLVEYDNGYDKTNVI